MQGVNFLRKNLFPWGKYRKLQPDGKFIQAVPGLLRRKAFFYGESWFPGLADQEYTVIGLTDPVDPVRPAVCRVDPGEGNQRNPQKRVDRSPTAGFK